MKIVFLSLALCIVLSAVDAKKHKKMKSLRNYTSQRSDEGMCTSHADCQKNMDPKAATPCVGEDSILKEELPTVPDQRDEGIHFVDGCKVVVGEGESAACECIKPALGPEPGASDENKCVFGEDDATQCPDFSEDSTCAEEKTGCKPTGGACTCPDPEAAAGAVDNVDAGTGDNGGKSNGQADPTYRKVSKKKKAVKIHHEKPAENLNDEEERVACTGTGCEDSEDENDEVKEPAKPKAKAVKNKLKSKKHKSIKKKQSKKNIH